MHPATWPTIPTCCLASANAGPALGAIDRVDDAYMIEGDLDRRYEEIDYEAQLPGNFLYTAASRLVLRIIAPSRGRLL